MKAVIFLLVLLTYICEASKNKSKEKEFTKPLTTEKFNIQEDETILEMVDIDLHVDDLKNEMKTVPEEEKELQKYDINTKTTKAPKKIEEETAIAISKTKNGPRTKKCLEMMMMDTEKSIGWHMLEILTRPFLIETILLTIFLILFFVEAHHCDYPPTKVATTDCFAIFIARNIFMWSSFVGFATHISYLLISPCIKKFKEMNKK